MPKTFNYEVNTKTKLIEPYTNWQGGIKSVDTENARDIMFLRDAENISITDYNFLESRYGLLETDRLDAMGDIKGHFEYVESDKTITNIIIAGGRVYVNGEETPPIENPLSDYPNFLAPGYPLSLDNQPFIEASRINNLLYIFTGVYPLYYTGDGSIYFLESKVPSSLEIESLGHNLLSQDLDEDYYPTLPFNNTVDSEISPTGIGLTGSQLYPIYPSESDVTHFGQTFQVGSDLNLVFSFDMLTPYVSGAGAFTYIVRTIETKLSSESQDKYTEAVVPPSARPSITNIPSLAQEDFYVYSVNSNFFFFLKGLGLGDHDVRINFKVLQYADYSNDPLIFNEINLSGIVVPVTVQTIPIGDYSNLPKGLNTCNRVIEYHGKLLVYGSDLDGIHLYASDYKDPTYFPSFHFMSFDNDQQESLTSVQFFLNILVAQTRTNTYGIKGNTMLDPLLYQGIDRNDQFTKFTINSTVGCIAPKSARPVRNRLFFLSLEGIMSLKSLFATDDRYNVELIDLNISNLIPVTTDAVGIQHDSQYWINFPDEEGSPTFRYYIDKGAWVKDVYAIPEFKGVFKYYVGDGNLRIVTKTTEGIIYSIIVDEGLTKDIGFSPVSKFTSLLLNQGFSFHKKKYKELKFDLTRTIDGTDVKYPDFNTVIISGDNNDIVTVTASTIQGHDYTWEIDLVDDPTLELLVEISSVDKTTGNTTELTSKTVMDGDTQVNFTAPYNSEEIEFTTTPINKIPETVAGYIQDVVVLDTTYSENLDFNVWVMTEVNTLATPETTEIQIIDNESVVIDTIAPNLNLNTGTRLGTWKFGTSSFGDIQTAIKTLKLSGSGYNIKFVVENTTDSKWTLEAVGVTFKVKKARSR